MFIFCLVLLGFYKLPFISQDKMRHDHSHEDHGACLDVSL